MNLCARNAIASPQKVFARIARDVFSLDPGIRWVAVEEIGCPPSWAWRDPESGKLCLGETTSDDELVDPLLLMLAEGRDDLCGDSENASARHLLFVVLAYRDMAQIVVRLGRGAHVSVATDPHLDAYRLGARLARLLHSRSELPPGR